MGRAFEGVDEEGFEVGLRTRYDMYEDVFCFEVVDVEGVDVGAEEGVLFVELIGDIKGHVYKPDIY